MGASFDGASALYQQARPDYPTALIDRVIEITGVRAGDQVLEIGCATGKATLPFARRGFRITCIEPGSNLAATAREVVYDAEGYIDLLNTFSGHIVMQPWQRERLYTEIRRRLAERSTADFAGTGEASSTLRAGETELPARSLAGMGEASSRFRGKI